MKKVKFIFFSLVLFLILISAIVLVLAKILVTPENIEASFAYECSKYFGQEIKIEKTDIKYLREITLQGITITPVKGKERKTFTCKEIEIRYSLLPLLAKKLLIKSIIIKDPVFSIQFKKIRFAGLPGMSSNPLKKPALGLLFLPDSLNVEKGKISLDHGNSKLDIENLKISANAISLMFPFNASISANLQGNEKNAILCDATITIPKKAADLSLTINRFPAAVISRFFEPAASLTDGFITVNSTLSFKGSDIRSQGTVSLENPSIPLTVKNETVTLKNADTKLNYKAAYNLTEKKLALEELNGSFISQKFTGNGSIAIKPIGPYFDITVASDNFLPAQIFNRLDIGLDSPFYGLRLSGSMGFRAHLKGTPGKDLSPTIAVNLKGNRIIYPPLANLQPELIGNFTLDNKNISVKTFTIRAIGSTFTFTGSIPDYKIWPPKPNLRVTTSRLDVAHLFNEEPDLSKAEPLVDIGPFNFSKISFNGPLNLGDSYLYGIPLKNVRGEYVFENNIFSIQDLTGGIGEGTFELSARIDLGVEGLDYYLHLNLKNAGLDSLSTIISPAFRRYVQGTLSGKCALKGNGTSPVSLNHNLKADASFYMKDGLIRNLVFKPPLSSFIDMTKMKAIPFRSGTLNARLRDGVIDTDNAIISDYLEFYSEGDIYLDTYMDLEAKIKISEEVFKGGKALSRFLPREAGLISLPLIIRGTFKQPDVSLPEETLNFIMKESLPGLIMGLMGGNKDQETDASFQELMSVFEKSMKKKKSAAEKSAEDREE